MIDLSPDQKKAIDTLKHWFTTVENKSQTITLGGYAGTGKTTLIAHFRQLLNLENRKLKVAFCSYTGRATRVMKNKLLQTGSIVSRDSVSTIHGLIYSPIEDSHEQIVGWELKTNIEADLIIVDEASMVDSFIWHDLTSFGIPILAVGDHGQLPPIREGFNLMAAPELVLEHIHRQAEKSPIIKLSLLARETGRIPVGDYGPNVRKVDSSDPESQTEVGEWLDSYLPDTLILCGYNSTRLKLNKEMRALREFDSDQPQTGDRVICLRNNHDKGIANGMLGTVQAIQSKDTDWYEAVIAMDDEDELYDGLIYKPQFNRAEPVNFTADRRLAKRGDLFDFGYALTVHKAQGSQAKRVIVFEERFPKMTDDDWRRWLYTAVTRAEEELYLIGR